MSMEEHTTDESLQTAERLVARIAAGDRSAELELVRKYSPAVRFVLSRRSSDRERVKDAQQETFIVVLERLRGSGIDQPAALASFIQQTAVNILLGDLRRDARRKTQVDMDAVLNQIDTGPGIAEQIDRNAESQRVRAAIEQLGTPRDRQVLYLYYVEEQDKEDICRDLGISLEHFRRVLFRARQRFLDLLHRDSAVRRSPGGAGLEGETP